MAKKKHDPKAKAKRQKVIAAVGGVLLLALLAFQVPRTLKMMHPQDQSAQSSSPSTTTSTISGTPALAPPSLDGSTGATSGASGARPGWQSSWRGRGSESFRRSGARRPLTG